MIKLRFALLALALASSTASAVGDNAKQGSGGDAKQPPSTATVAGSKVKQQGSGGGAMQPSSTASAAGGNAKPQVSGDSKRQEMFLKMKQARVNAINERVAMMQTVLGCTNAATSLEQMKACMPQPSGGGSTQAKPCS